MQKTVYAGIHADNCGGTAHPGQIIEDAWLFGIIPETGTGAGRDPVLGEDD